jgi:hypothetical protein
LSKGTKSEGINRRSRKLADLDLHSSVGKEDEKKKEEQGSGREYAKQRCDVKRIKK